uniref:Uncharacterized protein n=1 Tax=Podarcis muralis TaxID=64176 RepID=A0A670K986_PODMU
MSLIMLLTPKWKEAKIKANQEWIQKLMEYAEIVRLTGIIINQENKHFIKECVASEYRLRKKRELQAKSKVTDPT